jgi:hypothetical protein
MSKHTLAMTQGIAPYRGPCAICGGPDARHRLFDSLRVDTGTDAEAAREYRVPVLLVRIVRAQKRRPNHSDWRGIVS